MSTSSNPLWEAHVERLLRLHGTGTPVRRTPLTAPGTPDAAAALLAEWTAAPPGRLGRRLLAEVDAYLGFFAIARGG
jgi:hypothetical protein